jgi:hypothetical protein
MSTFVFNIKFHDNSFGGIRVLLITHMPYFNHHRPHLLLERPFGSLPLLDALLLNAFPQKRGELIPRHQ